MNKSTSGQIKRIRQMERHFTRAASAIEKLSTALTKYEDVQEDIAALSDYYGSELWKQDFDDDEARRLPVELKRGVLSEDSIWNLLEALSELRQRAKRL